MSSHPKPSLIALTGFMGSGKSSVGHALASVLKWRFVDLDCEIEREQGRKIREIFANEGEARFREIETASLRSVLATAPRPLVLATGGGTYVQSQNAKLMHAQEACVVFLEGSAEVLLRRCCGKGDADEAVRPLARERDAFVELYEQRLPLYRRADLTVNSDNKHPGRVARDIAKLLGLNFADELTTEG